MRLLYIDPVGDNPKVHAALQDFLTKCVPKGVTLDVENLGMAPQSLESYYYLSLIGPDLLRRIKKAENEGYDAAIIGCFCDPTLESAKEICERMVVVGVMEASVHLVSFLAARFGILAASQKSLHDFRINLHKYGLSERFTGFRTLDIAVEDLTTDANFTERRMCEEIELAIKQDKAEAIILGCTKQLGHYRQLQERFGVPIIDPSLAGLQTALHLASVRGLYGWYTSNAITYAPPPKGELSAWGLDSYYNLKGLF